MMRRRLITSFALLCPMAGWLILLPSGHADGVNRPAVAVTFNKDVAPIFYESCAECHRPGEAAPMSLLSFKDARPWAKSIREKVVNREMPPWHADPHVGQFANDRRLSQAEVETIVAWVDGGAKEGDPKELPPAPKFTDGWNIGQPDLVLQMPEEFTLSASGPDEYQNFDIPTSFTEDKYVQAVEARPGNRRIVHHIVASVEPPPPPDAPRLSREEQEARRAQMLKDSILEKDGLIVRVKADAPVYDDGCSIPSGGNGTSPDGAGGGRDVSGDGGEPAYLGGFAPGHNPDIWEPGTAKKIPAGSKIRLQVHYSRTTGKAEKDRSMVGLIFARKPPERVLRTRWVQNMYFRIPPGAGRHRVTACWTTPDDIRLYSLLPHMHYRGAAAEVKAFYPGGRAETLLNVPDYDFSWQTQYYLKRPLSIPKGTTITVTGYFDNSPKNRYNPDPARAVRWGEPTYDEMMMSFVEYVVETPPASAARTR